MNQKYTSADTSINGAKAPAIYGMKKAIEIMAAKTVIDVGGGKFDTAIEKAAKYGAKVAIYDKYNRDEKHNAVVLDRVYDVAVISNVLNVIAEPEVRAGVLLTAALRAPIILVTVYEGDGSGCGRVSKKDCWQENRKTADYVAEIECVLTGWTVERRGKLIIAHN